MRQLFAVAALAAAAGCGGGAADGLVLVAGVVKVDDQPAGNVLVTYVPQDKTPGNGGAGVTDSTGRYEVVTPQGKKGLPPGAYKVTLSRKLNPDGSPPDPNVPPIESQARETLAARHTDPDKTDLKINLSADDKRSFDFAVPAVKKK
jgi:hypothetical protein